MEPLSPIHRLSQLLFPGRHNLLGCLDAARWLCEWLLTGGGGRPAVRECEHVQARLRDALATVPADGLATVQRLLLFLQRASGPSRPGRGGVFFDPLDLARDPERFWRRVGWPEARTELRECHALLLQELQAAAREAAPRLETWPPRFRLVHYYTVPWEDVLAGTPPAVMIATRQPASGQDAVFAWHLVAQEEGIPPAEIPARQAELEGRMLQAFCRHLDENPRTRWLHWKLGSLEYGFPALAQRARALGLGAVFFPGRRLIDLAAVLERELGEDYVPHPRLPNLIRLNGINAYELLGRAELNAAFRAGDYRRMLHSLLRQLHCLQRLVEVATAGTLRTARGDFGLRPGPAGIGATGWMFSARGVLDAGRARTTPEPASCPTRLGGEILAAAEPRAPAGGGPGGAGGGNSGDASVGSESPVAQASVPLLLWEGEDDWDELTPLVRRLLRYMHGRPRADLGDLCPVVWGKDAADVSESALHSAIYKANAFLGQRERHTLEKVRGEPILRWV